MVGRFSVLMALVLGLAVTTLWAEEPVQPSLTDKQPTTALERGSYLLGMRLSRSNPLAADADILWLAQGLLDALQGADPKINIAESTQIKEAFREAIVAMQEQKGDLNAEKGEAYMQSLKGKEGVTFLPSGLAYEVISKTDGMKPTAEDTVRAHYTGTLIDGREFDSSRKHGTDPVEFPLKRVIKGWTLGLQLMPVGSTYRFHIPAELAYGANAPSNIGPNQTLIFEVELVSIKGK